MNPFKLFIRNEIKLFRTHEVSLCNKYMVGDILSFTLNDGTEVQAMAMQQEDDGMIFCLVDCLPGEYPMNSTRTNEGGYEDSDLRKKLNGEIFNLFPETLKILMTQFDNGDLLRLPTEKEIFGENYYGDDESLYVKQWEPMKKRRNRMSFDGSKNENLQWYWLMNKVSESATGFSRVYYGGCVDCTGAPILLAFAPCLNYMYKIK